MANPILFLGVGAALMFLADPQNGRRRRAGLKDKLESTRRRIEHGRDVVVRDAANRAQGLIAETRGVIEARRERDVAVVLSGPSFGSVAQGAIAAWKRENWSPAQRALAGAFGSGLAAYGYLRGGVRGFAYCAAGGALLARATANRNLVRLVKDGINGVNVEKTIHVEASIDEVFAYWRNLENLPLWMSHVREVRYLGGDRYHWVVDGPAGTAVEWDSELLNVVENREMTWRSVPGSTVEHVGRVRFEEMGEGTRIHVQLKYIPPGGLLGHAVARAFGVDPGSEMDDDLARMKSSIETGRPPRDAAAMRYGGELPASPARH